MQGFWAELKRREVVKVGIAYVATGWIVVQVAAALFPIFQAPPWVIRVLTTLIVLGFPVALIFSWVYELTPDGLKRTSDANEPSPLAAQTSRRLNYLIVGLLVIAVGLFVADRLMPDKAEVAASVPVPDKAPGNARDSIAVLPFLNMSGDPEQQFLADGLTEEMLNRLARVPTLKVPARTSSFYYKDKAPDVREIGAALGVGTVLEGSVRRSGEKLRITAQLIDVNTGYHMWSETYDRQAADIFAIEDDITARIMSELSIRLGSVIAASRPADPEIYQLVLRGRFHWNQRSEEGLKKAEELFREATRRDPTYAAAFTGLADTYLSQYDYGMLAWEDSTVKARAAATKALELNDGLAEGHASLAHILMHEWQWQKAEQEFQRAIELNPNYVVAYHWYALCFTALGRVDEAVESMQRAIKLDPVSTRINADLGMAYLAAGRYAEAVAQEDRTLELAPQAVVPKWIRGMALEQMGHYDRAEADMKFVLEAWDGDPSVAGSLGHLYAISGKQAEARRMLADLVARDGKEEVAFFVALIHSGLNEKEEALKWLERAVDQRSGSVRYLKMEVRLKDLRGEPRYRALMTRVGLPL